MSALRLFVYGTLKRGGRFHDRFCRGALSIEPASAIGRLEMLPAGYPMLEVPASSVLAEGTADPLADVATQERIEVGKRAAADSEWQDIDGELMTFDDPSKRLPPIDELEDFRPGARSLYRRVLLPVRREDGRVVAAWAYVNPRTTARR